MSNAALLVYLGQLVKERGINWCAGSIEIDSDNLTEEIIRTKKAHMQSNTPAERVDIFAVADANEAGIIPLIKTAGEKLRAVFAEDFIIVKINLLVFITESNEPIDNYPLRAKRTYDLLVHLTAPAAFDAIFLLSDRNELGVVNKENHTKACNGIDKLPLVLKQSDFYENMHQMAAARGRVLFASLGFGEVPEENEPKEIFNRDTALHLAKILETELNVQKKENTIDITLPITRGEMQRAITAVAANHVPAYRLKGASLEQAEDMLFGSGASTFYKKNINIQNEEVEISTTLLRDLAARQQYLSSTFVFLGESIRSLKNSLSEKKEHTVSTGFFQGIDKIKDAIGAYYYEKLQLDYLEKKQEGLTLEYEKISPFISTIHQIIDTLSNTPPSTKKTKPASPEIAKENACCNISLLRNDELIFEEFELGTTERPEVLRLIGGFVPEDLTRFGAMLKHKDFTEDFLE